MRLGSAMTPVLTVVYLYDGDEEVIGEVDASGNVLGRYTQTQATDELLSELRSGTASYYLADALDSITSLSNASSALANTYTYNSFGRLTASTGTLTNPFQYTARDSDTETGLYYYRARYYDPAIGRFTSEDPSEFADGLNLYRYVHNNPALYSDPTGLTSYQGFNPTDLAQMQAAVQKVKDKLNSGCSSCAGPEKNKLLNALENATFVFNSKLKGCGYVGPIDYLKHRAQISPAAFGAGCCYLGDSSNALPSTVLHETFHLIHKLPHEPSAYQLEEQCFGCQRPPS
jgi:RHS repeat-associated protein